MAFILHTDAKKTDTSPRRPSTTLPKAFPVVFQNTHAPHTVAKKNYHMADTSHTDARENGHMGDTSHTDATADVTSVDTFHAFVKGGRSLREHLPSGCVLIHSPLLLVGMKTCNPPTQNASSPN